MTTRLRCIESGPWRRVPPVPTQAPDRQTLFGAPDYAGWRAGGGLANGVVACVSGRIRALRGRPGGCRGAGSGPVWCSGRGARERPFLDGQVAVEVDLGGLDAFVAEPEGREPGAPSKVPLTRDYDRCRRGTATYATRKCCAAWRCPSRSWAFASTVRRAAWRDTPLTRPVDKTPHASTGLVRQPHCFASASQGSASGSQTCAGTAQAPASAAGLPRRTRIAMISHPPIMTSQKLMSR